MLGESAINAVNLTWFCLTLPVILAWRFSISFFLPSQQKKHWKRILGDGAFRWFIHTQRISMMPAIFGSSTRTYLKWCKDNGLEPQIEDVGHGGQLFWIGDTNSSVKFWRFVQQTMNETEDVKVKIAILDYTLIPDAHFPVPLQQAVASVNYLLSRGIKAKNIQLTGDSAGANLVNQLLLHMVHPVKTVPQVKSGTSFRGAYLMSPWVIMKPRDTVKSYTENAIHDVVAPVTKFGDFGGRVLSGFTENESDIAYVDLLHASEDWYDGIERTVERVLITAGGAECLRDDIIEFAKIFCKAHRNAELIVDNIGVHDDPFYDFLVGENKHAELTPFIVQWFADGFLDK